MSAAEITQAVAAYYDVARPTWTSPLVAEGQRRMKTLAEQAPDDAALLASERDQRIADFDREHPKKAAEIRALLDKQRRR